MHNNEKLAAIFGVTPRNPLLDEIKRTIQEEQHTATSHLAEIAYGLKLLVGLHQRMLTKLEEALGTPKGAPYVLSQSDPSQNTVYAGSALAYDGVIRSMVVSGPGNVTIKINDSVEIGGAVTLAIVGCNGNAVSVDLHARMPLGATLSVATDSNAGTGVLVLSAWIEPISESNPEIYRMRR